MSSRWLPYLTFSVQVGYGASPIVFGPQFASVKARQLNTSLRLIASAVSHADRCGGGGRGSSGMPAAAGVVTRPRTTLIFKSPAFNIDPVNLFRQQANFARRMRPMVEAAGVTFLDTYPATRHAVMQHTAGAIRFDHFSTFHFHDAGRYIQAQLLLHVLRLLSTL